MVVLAQLLIALQNVPHLVVGQAGVRAHHRLVELGRGQAPLGGDGHLAHHAQAIDLWVQRAQSVGQHFRQHRDHLRREVDRVAAAARFVIQRGAWTHIVADVGDRDPQAPATAAFFLAVHGVVEVARIFTVDGDQRQFAQIDAALLGRFRHLLAEIGHLLFHLRRPGMRDLMGAQRDVHRHAGAHFIAEDLDDLADRLSTAGRALSQLHHHHKAHARAADAVGWDQNIEAQTAVVRHHEAGTGVHEEAADNLAGFRHQHAHDARFAAPFTVRTQRLRQHHITVDRHFHLFGRQVQIVFAAFNAQEAVAVAVADHRAAQQIQTLRQRIALAAGKH